MLLFHIIVIHLFGIIPKRMPHHNIKHFFLHDFVGWRAIVIPFPLISFGRSQRSHIILSTLCMLTLSIGHHVKVWYYILLQLDTTSIIWTPSVFWTLLVYFYSPLNLFDSILHTWCDSTKFNAHVYCILDIDYTYTWSFGPPTTHHDCSDALTQLHQN